MLASSIIVKKRDGGELADDEIHFMVDGFCSGNVADYQMSALTMAICLRGMTARETTTLTQAMLGSGDRLPKTADQDSDSGNNRRVRVDKHSTGGLGDKVSLILAPLLATCGVDVPMVSGRGLGLTGGTLDKLESIEGFQVEYSAEKTTELLKDVGACIITASDRIAPADRRLYALRDVTGTVESVPLITASILSKKLAASLDALVMDVKVGSGAFMKSEADAMELAKSIVSVGNAAGMPTTAILSDMDQPLGEAVGNAIEVNESIEVLQGKPGEIRELTIALCADVLVNCGQYDSQEIATKKLIEMLDSGQAMERFEKLVSRQSGKLSGPLPLAPATEITASTGGFVNRVDCQSIGEAIVSWGGGRRKAGDAIDHQVGIRVHHRIGDPVESGQTLLTIHSHPADAKDYATRLGDAIEVTEQAPPKRSLILSRLPA
ncbi:Pyrimidine-nucleoside phosphorylase [Rubripirellula obstinata]|uniref:thymidine phosphorylase n=1 Tax=Rubripirellula obstinata TaxID=406547 RepID=A0A5B1CL03_9BACT|nr:thymidine phosphorylase [Rubripirellula obstinata]KAA1261877.1 Pyrimidine-nucleoside phosphorylase [Rubripirellula obstinata]